MTFYKDYFPATGAQYAEYDKMWGPWTLGVSFCKRYILQAGRLLESATYITAFWTALLAPCLGLAAFMMLCCSHRPGHCECICCLSGTSSFATMMCNFLAVCSILQFLSLVVLASPYCGTEYNGTCQLHRDGWLSLSAAILWMVSAFAAWRIPKSDLDWRHMLCCAFGTELGLCHTSFRIKRGQELHVAIRQARRHSDIISSYHLNKIAITSIVFHCNLLSKL